MRDVQFAIFETSDKGALPTPGQEVIVAAKWIDEIGTQIRAQGAGRNTNEAIISLLKEVYQAATIACKGAVI